MIAVVVLLAAGGAAVIGWFIRLFFTAAELPDPGDQQPAGRRLVVDTRTGSHDHYPHMSDHARDAVTAALEGSLQATATEES